MKPHRLLAIAAFALIATGCSGRRDANVVEATVDGDDPTTLLLVVDACEADPSLERLEESATEVRVLVRVNREWFFSGGSDCQDVVEVNLDDPLGDRTLLDDADDSPIPIAP